MRSHLPVKLDSRYFDVAFVSASLFHRLWKDVFNPSILLGTGHTVLARIRPTSDTCRLSGLTEKTLWTKVLTVKGLAIHIEDQCLTSRIKLDLNVSANRAAESLLSLPDDGLRGGLKRLGDANRGMNPVIREA